MSRQEQFMGSFVRTHARYATVLHIAFLALIIWLVRSRNFSTVIIYELSWIHVILFILFFILLALLGSGIMNALRWKKPRISLKELSMSNFEKEFTTEEAVTEDEKTPIILSHIPFLGIYLAAKYGGKLSQGEKFGTWFCIIWIISVYIDPSLTLLITLTVLTIFWIVYQAVGTANNSTVHLLGNRLLGGRDIHIYIKSIFRYAREIFQHEQKVPSWNEIYEKTMSSYMESSPLERSAFLFVPLINLPLIFRLRKITEIQKYTLQWTLISIGFIYSLIIWSTTIGVLMCLAGFWAYVQTLFHKSSDIPLISEISEIVLYAIKWREEKSKPEQIVFSTQK